MLDIPLADGHRTVPKTGSRTSARRARPRSRAVPRAAALVAAVLSMPHAHADDASAGVPLPALRSQPAHAVSVDSAEVRLIGHRVSVTLQAQSTRPRDAVALQWRSAHVAWTGGSEPYPDREFPELTLQVDDSPTSARSQAVAAFGDTDISSLIAAASIDPWTVTQTPPFVNPPGLAASDAQLQARAALARLGAIASSSDGDLAKWTAQRRIDASLATGTAHSVELTYTARPAFALATAATLATPAMRARYCISPAALAHLRALPPESLPRVAEEFAVPVGIDGAQPRSATLAVSDELPSPDEPLAIDASPDSTLYFWCDAAHRGASASGQGSVGFAAVDPQGVVRVLRYAHAASQPAK